ncbi:hypothetical protein NL529_28365, partial [Klebsiella pneumoniae]|nr:hypothetical protein [Klebsiella pneumoniae]
TAVTEALDGQCDLAEALQAIVNANLGNTPTYNECSAAVGPNVITFSGAAAGGVIQVPGNFDLPFVWGDTTIQGPVAIAGGGPGSDHHLFRM